jgi:sec-independent protein translocase protein TatA
MGDMPDLGIGEIAIIALIIFALFGYKKLPDAARSLGRSMRVFKAETRGLKEDDVRGKAEARTSRGPLGDTPAPAAPEAPQAAAPAAEAPRPAAAEEPTSTAPKTDEPAPQRATSA